MAMFNVVVYNGAKESGKMKMFNFEAAVHFCQGVVFAAPKSCCKVYDGDRVVFKINDEI